MFKNTENRGMCMYIYYSCKEIKQIKIIIIYYNLIRLIKIIRDSYYCYNLMILFNTHF